MKTKFWIVLFAVFLTACQASMDEQLERAEVCITPPETFAYSIFPHDDLIQIEKTLPPDPWQLVAPIKSDFEFGHVYGIRVQEDHQEIWIGFLYYYKFLTYDPASKEWGEVEIGLGDRIQIEELFFTQDGSVYAVPYMMDRDKSSEMSVLSKYNEETKTFEFIEYCKKYRLPLTRMNTKLRK